MFIKSIDTTASVDAATRAVSNLRPEGSVEVRGFLDALFGTWKFDFGRPPSTRGVGLLDFYTPPAPEPTEDERLSAVSKLQAWECAGPLCGNSIDLFIKIWTEHGAWLQGHLDANPNLFYWMLGTLILDHSDRKFGHSVVSAGQILISLYASADRDWIEYSDNKLAYLGGQQAAINRSRRNGGKATGETRKLQGSETKAEIHRMATALLLTKEKREIAGIITQKVGKSKSTVHEALQSHPSGKWRKDPPAS
ncbi:hypothetical protein CR105_03015 [Massilia eurypsychrophila]|uniref:Uncharacterized protein n=1 Tax=Massilia eurypsychrophila TaxID=1485217 RepID=A0A2G8TJF4_9BURK|nr:hypothetical protein [Massilia eurypsychrophila]PIL46079.1 hypothetical protein CR105_03015 [Massilia eurypsychrophila]